MKIKKGMKAPAFCLPDQNEKKVCLKNFKGGWVVLYFYPKDSTPGCTIEAKDFTKGNPSFKKLNAEVLGVSADSCGSHNKFITKQKLKITLLSDEEKTVIKKYGVWNKKKFMGREFMGIVRTTFLIDPEGKVAHAWPEVKVKGHAKEVKETLEELNR